MGFTDPFVGTDRKRLSDQELAQAIRIDMAAELDAINLYQAHRESTDNEAAKRVIGHIIGEEKNHLEEFRQLLYLLDPEQAAAASHAAEEMEANAAAARNTVPSPSPESALPSPPGFTVGSLRDRP